MRTALKTYNETPSSITKLPPVVTFYVYLQERPDTIDANLVDPILLQYWIDKFVDYESLRIEVIHSVKVVLMFSRVPYFSNSLFTGTLGEGCYRHD